MPFCHGLYEVEGTVTYQGKPVKDGEIIFAPDTSKGNVGPGGYAIIKNGQFKTTKNKGVVGGAYILTVSGRPLATGESEVGEAFATGDLEYMLFPVQEMTFDLRREDTTLEIQVPAE